MQFPYPEDDGRNVGSTTIRICSLTYLFRPQCAAQVNVDYREVSQCMNGGLATQLQLEAERITHRIARPYPSFVPTVVFNNVFDQTLQNRAIQDFKGVVCDLLNNSIPNYC